MMGTTTVAATMLATVFFFQSVQNQSANKSKSKLKILSNPKPSYTPSLAVSHGLASPRLSRQKQTKRAKNDSHSTITPIKTFKDIYTESTESTR